MSLNCGNSSPFIINRFLLKLFNSGCLKKLNYWGIALKAYAKLHLNNKYINIPWPQASTQIFCEPHNILKHNFSLGQCRREKKREEEEKNWPLKLNLSPQSSRGFFAHLFDPFSTLSWRLKQAKQSFIGHSRVNPKLIFENEGKRKVFIRKQCFFFGICKQWKNCLAFVSLPLCKRRANLFVCCLGDNLQSALIILISIKNSFVDRFN